MVSGYFIYDLIREDLYEFIKFFCESDFLVRIVIFFLSNFILNKELGLGIFLVIYRLK